MTGVAQDMSNHSATSILLFPVICISRSHDLQVGNQAFHILGKTRNRMH